MKAVYVAMVILGCVIVTQACFRPKPQPNNAATDTSTGTDRPHTDRRHPKFPTPGRRPHNETGGDYPHHNRTDTDRPHPKFPKHGGRHHNDTDGDYHSHEHKNGTKQHNDSDSSLESHGGHSMDSDESGRKHGNRRPFGGRKSHDRKMPKGEKPDEEDEDNEEGSGDATDGVVDEEAGKVRNKRRGGWKYGRGGRRGGGPKRQRFNPRRRGGKSESSESSDESIDSDSSKKSASDEADVSSGSGDTEPETTEIPETPEDPEAPELPVPGDEEGAREPLDGPANGEMQEEGPQRLTQP